MSAKFDYEKITQTLITFLLSLVVVLMGFCHSALNDVSTRLRQVELTQAAICTRLGMTDNLHVQAYTETPKMSDFTGR